MRDEDDLSSCSDTNVNAEMLHYIDALETKYKLLGFGSKKKKLKDKSSEQQSI